MKKLILAGVISTSMILAGCQTAPSSEDTGKVIGGVVGGILGSQVGGGRGKTAATIAGVLVGAYIGGHIGRGMDANDRRNAYDSLENNRTGQPSRWHNPDSNREYAVTPTKTYTSSAGQDCRDYTTEVIIDGRREIAKGTACRESNGSWRVVN